MFNRLQNKRLTKEQRAKLSAERRRQRAAYQSALSENFVKQCLEHLAHGGVERDIKAQAAFYMTRRAPSIAERRAVIKILLERLATAQQEEALEDIERIRTIAALLKLERLKFEAILSRWRRSAGFKSKGRAKSKAKGQARATKRIPKCYRILECSPDATDQEIKRAYRRLAAALHPDKHSSSSDTTPEMLTHYTRAFQELQGAYQEVCKLRSKRV